MEMKSEYSKTYIESKANRRLFIWIGITTQKTPCPHMDQAISPFDHLSVTREEGGLDGAPLCRACPGCGSSSLGV